MSSLSPRRPPPIQYNLSTLNLPMPLKSPPRALHGGNQPWANRSPRSPHTPVIIPASAIPPVNYDDDTSSLLDSISTTSSEHTTASKTPHTPTPNPFGEVASDELLLQVMNSFEKLQQEYREATTSPRRTKQNTTKLMFSSPEEPHSVAPIPTMNAGHQSLQNDGFESCPALTYLSSLETCHCLLYMVETLHQGHISTHPQPIIEMSVEKARKVIPEPTQPLHVFGGSNNPTSSEPYAVEIENDKPIKRVPSLHRATAVQKPHPSPVTVEVLSHDVEVTCEDLRPMKRHPSMNRSSLERSVQSIEESETIEDEFNMLPEVHHTDNESKFNHTNVTSYAISAPPAEFHDPTEIVFYSPNRLPQTRETEPISSMKHTDVQHGVEIDEEEESSPQPRDPFSVGKKERNIVQPVIIEDCEVVETKPTHPPAAATSQQIVHEPIVERATETPTSLENHSMGSAPPPKPISRVPSRRLSVSPSPQPHNEVVRLDDIKVERRPTLNNNHHVVLIQPHNSTLDESKDSIVDVHHQPQEQHVTHPEAQHSHHTSGEHINTTVVAVPPSNTNWCTEYSGPSCCMLPRWAWICLPICMCGILVVIIAIVIIFMS